MSDIFDEIRFDKESHSYFLKGKSLTSVTKLLFSLEQEVDWSEKAKSVSVKRGVETHLILKEWEEAGLKAREKGHNVHTYIENRLKYNTERLDSFPEMVAFDSFWDFAREKMQIYKIEWIVGDYILGIGGTIDCVFYSINTGKYHIFDWKTNKSFSYDNGWQTYKHPFEDLDDSAFNKYSLQLSIYKLILQQNTHLPLGDSYVVWLNSVRPGEYYTTIKVADFTERANRWILSIDKK